MSAISGLLRFPGRASNWIDDRMNPIVVKELRQAVKSRFVVSVLMLMLTLLMLILAVTLINQDSYRGFDEDAGADLFLVFQSILLATCMLFVPVYVGVRLAAERSSATSDLIYVTTIRPSSIVWGKLLAGMVVTALTFSACAPFMVITYLLRGIDLPTILFVMGMDVLIVLAATQLAIFVGTMPIGWPVKALLGLVLVFLSVMCFTGMTIFVEEELLRIGIGSAMDDSEFWVVISVMAGTWLAAIAMIFFLSVAMIAPATANRALWPRLYFSLVWVASLVGFVVLSVNVDTLDPLLAWLIAMFILLFFAAVICSSEREVFGPRLRRGIPRSGLARVPAFFFYSGAAGGLLWVQALIGITLLATFIVRANFLDPFEAYAATSGWSYYDSFPEHWLQRFGSSAMWVIGYMLLSVVICRRAAKIKNAPAITGVVGLIIIAAACAIPMIVAYALDPDRWDRKLELWLIINPFGPIFCEDNDWSGTYGSITFVLSTVFFTLMQIVTVPWYIRQMRAFTPPKETVGRPATDEAATVEASEPNDG